MQLAQTVQAFQHVIFWKMSHLAEAAKLHEFTVVFHWTPKSRASKADTAHPCVESSAILTSTHLWGMLCSVFGRKSQMGHAWRPKQRSCVEWGNYGTLRLEHKLKPSNTTELANPPPTCSQNNHLPSGSSASRVCGTSQKCQIMDVFDHSPNQNHMLGV